MLNPPLQQDCEMLGTEPKLGEKRTHAESQMGNQDPESSSTKVQKGSEDEQIKVSKFEIDEHLPDLGSFDQLSVAEMEAGLNLILDSADPDQCAITDAISTLLKELKTSAPLPGYQRPPEDNNGDTEDDDSDKENRDPYEHTFH